MRLFGLLILLCYLSRSAAIRGPEEIKGHIGGSLTVTCNYTAKYERHKKWWCRGVDWKFCRILVETTGTEQEVKKDRVTLRDSQKELRFTVTMERLRINDTDTYWCRTSGSGSGSGVFVKVFVGPAPATTITRRTPKHFPDVTSLLSSTIIPIVFLLSLLMVSLVWRNLKRQRAAARDSSKPDTQEDDEVCYAHLTLQTCNLEPTYANMAPWRAPSTSRSPEVIAEYSSIKSPKAGL